jgi:hypothetical protein
MDRNCVYEDKYFKVISPEFPLNCRDDGGHLIRIKKQMVKDRSDMLYQVSDDQIKNLRRKIFEILREPKYEKMAELAEL